MKHRDRPSLDRLAQTIQWLLSLDPDDPRNFKRPPGQTQHAEIKATTDGFRREQPCPWR